MINLLQAELSIRINRLTKKSKEILYHLKLRKCVEKLILVFINMSIIYEEEYNYQRVMESLKLMD